MRTFLLLLAMAACVAGAPAPPRTKAPEPLPESVVEAWEDAGARAGWMAPDRHRASLRFSNKLEDLDTTGAVPGFKSLWLRDAELKKLPMPGRPFGLCMAFAGAGDDDLR